MQSLGTASGCQDSTVNFRKDKLYTFQTLWNLDTESSFRKGRKWVRRRPLYEEILTFRTFFLLSPKLFQYECIVSRPKNSRNKNRL